AARPRGSAAAPSGPPAPPAAPPPGAPPRSAAVGARRGRLRRARCGRRATPGPAASAAGRRTARRGSRRGPRRPLAGHDGRAVLLGDLPELLGPLPVQCGEVQVLLPRRPLGPGGEHLVEVSRVPLL